MAAFTSRSRTRSQMSQWLVRTQRGSLAFTVPHLEHVLLEGQNRSAKTIWPPCRNVLYFSWRRSSPQPWSEMARGQVVVAQQVRNREVLDHDDCVRLARSSMTIVELPRTRRCSGCAGGRDAAFGQRLRRLGQAAEMSPRPHRRRTLDHCPGRRAAS